MELTYYLADWSTGNFYPRELPLEQVSLEAATDRPGELRASLDMRRMVEAPADYGSASDVISWLRAGTCSIVAVRVDVTAGNRKPSDEALGSVEWWVTGVSGTYASPVISITGREWPAYTEANVITKGWNTKSVDAIMHTRQMMSDLTTSGQTIALDCGLGGGGPIAAPAQWRAGTITYADAFKALGAGSSFEWRVLTDVRSDAQGVPVGVTRRLAFGVPAHRVQVDGVAVELVSPGRAPGSALDQSWETSVDRVVYDMWGIGAGEGKTLIWDRTDQSRPANMPRISRTVSDPNARTKKQIDVAIAKAVRQLREAPPFDVIVDASMLVPAVGQSLSYFRSPSLSMPTAIPEAAGARVLVKAWKWSSSQPDQFQLTVEAE